MTPEEKNLKCKLRVIHASLTQDLHDFQLEGTVHPVNSTASLKGFEEALREYHKTSKLYTDLWQRNRGYKT